MKIIKKLFPGLSWLLRSILFHRSGVIAASFLLISTVLGLASGSVISAGTRYHINHSIFEELPFDDGDFSYCLAYEYHEDAGYWQIGVDYAPDVTGAESTDYVITPQINLVFKDGIWLGGVGALRSYINDETAGGDWIDLYWQLLLGVQLPLFGLKVDLQTYYTFEEWDKVDEFDTDDLEFGVWLNFSF